MNFAKQLILKPISTGAIMPSSRYLSRVIINSAKLVQANIVVELGPGTGSFTGEIIEKIQGETDYFAIEINQSFVNHLKNKFLDVNVIHGSAENIVQFLKNRGHDKCDRVISGLPWTAFKSDDQERIISKIAQALSNDGLFLTFAYYPFNLLPRGRLFKKKLNKYFKNVEQTSIIINLPLAFVYICSN